MDSRRWPAAIAVLAALGLCSCAAHLLPKGGTRTLVATEGPDKALERIEPLKKGGSRLLYLYERGLILHDVGRFEESNAVLAKADERYEELYTKSLAREVMSLATTDELVPYRGPVFESAFAHYYRILNYLRLDDVEGAAVESRRLSRELQRCRDKGDSTYSGDPFLEYVTGVVYRMAGERNDADVSWRQADAGYRTLGPRYNVHSPPALECDRAENARLLGETIDQPPAEPCAAASDSSGRIYLFIEYGGVPAKVEHTLTLPIYRDEIADHPESHHFARQISSRCGHEAEHGRELAEILMIALPALEETTPRAGRGVVHWGNGRDPSRVAPAAVAADLGRLSRQAFDDDYDRVLMRALVRSVTKCLAREAARKQHEEEAEAEKEKEKQRRKEGKQDGEKEKSKGDGFLGWLAPRLFSGAVDALTIATERADIRCWSTLPGQILAARIELPPGRHPLAVDLYDPAGLPLGTWSIGEVDVAAGRTRMVRARLTGSGVPVGIRTPE